jgi:hypothetical protein
LSLIEELNVIIPSFFAGFSSLASRISRISVALGASGAAIQPRADYQNVPARAKRLVSGA